MKDLKLLVWLTQLGISVVVPLAGFILLGVWLRDQYGWGSWVVIAGVVLGIASAIDGFRYSLKTMEQLTKNSKKKDAPPPSISFNDHD